MRLTGKLGPQEFWARIDEGEARIRAAAGVLPLFGVDGPVEARMTGDWEWEGDRLVSAGLAYGGLQGRGAYVDVLTTSLDPAEVALGRRMTGQLLALYDDGVPAVRDRLAADAGARVVVDVEAVPCEFRLWRDGDGNLDRGRWWAAGRHGDVGLVIEASGDVDATQIRLVRVTDVEPYIAGRRAALRLVRGEDPEP